MEEKHALEEQKKKLEGDKATLEGEQEKAELEQKKLEGELTAERQKISDVSTDKQQLKCAIAGEQRKSKHLPADKKLEGEHGIIMLTIFSFME